MTCGGKERESREEPNGLGEFCFCNAERGVAEDNEVLPYDTKYGNPDEDIAADP
jgi:hypothetical protein